jgi:hypothetical protein
MELFAGVRGCSVPKTIERKIAMTSAAKKKNDLDHLSTVEKNRGHRGGPIEKHAEKERERIKKEEDAVVVNSDESFPASDPPSFNPGVTGTEEPHKKSGG